MTTALRITIPGYHRRTTLVEIASKEAGQTTDEIVRAYVQDKYAGWINANLPSAEYTVSNCDALGCTIEFTYEDDAEMFRRKVGGVPIAGGSEDA